MKKSLVITGVSGFLAFLSPFLHAATIAKFSPQALSESTNQIRVTFSEKMVALGVQPQADIFTLRCTPELAGTGRWEDEQTWTFDFKTKLFANKIPGGTKCTVELKSGLKAKSGQPVTGKSKFEFHVDGPNLLAIHPGYIEGDSETTVNEDQVFLLSLDTKVDESSVEKNVYLQVDGIASPVAVRVLSGRETQAILKAEPYLGPQFTGEDPVIAVQGKTKLPSNRKVTFVWGKGVRAQKGEARIKDLTLPMKTRPELSAQVTCTRENANAACSPLEEIFLTFNAPIPIEFAKDITITGSDGKPRMGKYNEKNSFFESVSFPAALEEDVTFKIALPEGIKDDAGRNLTNQKSFPLQIKTGKLAPLAKFSGDFGLIEAAFPYLPVTLRHLKTRVTALEGKRLVIDGSNPAAVVEWMKRLSRKQGLSRNYEKRETPLFEKADVGWKPFQLKTKVDDKDSEVVGLELKGSGLHIVEVRSQVLGQALLGKNQSMFVPAGALVTGMVVHAKWGRENSLFWVTSLSDASAVAGAKVDVTNCAGKTVWSGTTDQTGRVLFKGELKKRLGSDQLCIDKDGERFYSEYDRGFFVFAKKGTDFTFTHSSWTDGLEAWRFGGISSRSPAYGESDITVSTVLDRNLLRAGSTVSMKHFIRRQTMSGFAKVDAKDLPNTVQIRNYEAEADYSIPLTWDANGTSVTEFAIPKEAKLGTYNISLVRKASKEQKASYSSSNFQVLEFKVPLMKGTISFPSEERKLVQPGKLEAQLSVNYQDGGPAMNEPVTLRYTIDRMYGLYFEDYSGMNFGSEPVKEGRVSTDERREQSEKTTQVALKLNAKGSVSHMIPGLKGFTTPRTLTTQLEFVDKNSETQNVSRTLTIYPSERAVGVRAREPYNSAKKVEFEIAVLDVKGTPQSGVAPEIEIFSEATFTHRTRMVGGFYSSESYTEYKDMKLAVKCSGVTDKRGVLNCEAPMPESGSYIIQARVKDAKGNVSYGRDSVYVAGPHRAWYPSESSDRMDLLIADKNVKSGATAVFEVRMPFPEANVLVTVEREGVMDSFVTHVTTQNPVIKVPIKPQYAPGVFVSALAVRGRAPGDSQASALVDLGKPSFKVGLTQLKVDWVRHQLKVDIKPSKETFKPREEASVNVTVTDPAGKPVRNTEFAIAVIDEGLLELRKNDTWDLLREMMNERPLEVETSTAQMQVVGKRHFGLKAKPTGGDGGQAPTRELFDTLVFWKARVKTDADGKARVSFTMNDSLTKFRIAAIAHAGIDKFGTGETSILSKQDLVIIPSLSQFVRQGDKFAAEFTVRNSTAAKKSVSLSGRAHFRLANGKQETQDLPFKPLSLGAGESALVSLGDLTVKDGVDGMKFALSVQDASAKILLDACSKDPAEIAKRKSALDNMCIDQEVKPRVVTRTWMAQMSQLTPALAAVNLNLPADGLSERGGVKVSLLSSLASGLDTVKGCMEDYPFRSLEYSFSRAVTSGSRAQWEEAVKMLPSHLDQDGFAMYYPSRQLSYGSDALTAYILSLSQYSGYALPPETQLRMVTALSGFVEGRFKGRPDQPQTPVDTLVRRLRAIEVLTRMGKGNALWLTALPQVANEQIPTATLIDQISIYSKLSGIPEGAKTSEALLKAIDARMVRTGRSYKLVGDRYQCHCDLASHDVDQLRLILVLTSDPALTKAWEDALPKMVAGAIDLMKRGAWDLTVANAYGVLSMRSFARSFEKEKVDGLTTVTLKPGYAQSFEWSRAGKESGGTLNFGWKGAGDYRADFSHQGKGAPWAIVAVEAAVPLKSKIENHIQIEKTVSPAKTVWKRGDVVTVTLSIKAQSAFSYVSLIDPVPAGAKIISSGGEGMAYPDFQELAADSYRATFTSIAPDLFKVSYQIRLGNVGTFNLPSSRIEAIYQPENFAELPGTVWKVEP